VRDREMRKDKWGRGYLDPLQCKNAMERPLLLISVVHCRWAAEIRSTKYSTIKMPIKLSWKHKKSPEKNADRIDL